MGKKPSRAAAEALAATDWNRIDAMSDADIARQIAANPDAAPDMAPQIDVRAIRRSVGMTQAEFAAAYQFSVRTVQQGERGAKRPSGPAARFCGPSRPIPRVYAGRSQPRELPLTARLARICRRSTC
jgi:putative transcriptional regulator